MSFDLLNNDPEDGCGSADRVFCGQELQKKTETEKPVDESDEQRIARKIAALFGKKPLWG